MKEITLYGKYSSMAALVDDDDFEELAAYRWCYRPSKSGRVVWAARRVKVEEGTRIQYMHTLITGWSPVDHVNRNGLDNRRQNLRPASHGENKANTAKNRTFAKKPCSSIYKGVTWDKEKGKWRAQIVAKKRLHRLGLFVDEIDAAEAYDRAAKELHGAFACTNFQGGRTL